MQSFQKDNFPIDAEINLSSIGNQIEKARAHMDFSQREVTDRANFSASLLAKFESGETTPSLDSICRIAEIMDIPLDQLVQDCHPDFLIYTIDDYLSRISFEKASEIIHIILNLMGGYAGE